MPVIINGVSGAKSPEAKKKFCIRCNEERPESSFFMNKQWTKEGGRDKWCKECYAKIRDKEGLMEYFWENNLGWDEERWNNARSKAQAEASSNEVYINSSDDKRVRILDKLTIQYMNRVGIKFEEHNGVSYASHKKTKVYDLEDDPNLREYSPEFNGYFNRKDLEYLKNYYNRLEQDFSFVTENDRDYARKVCKASLQADKAMDDYVAGRCDYSVVRDATTLYDMLSKSGNFAACKRKPGENDNALSISEITLKLETNGHPCTRKIEWPKDSIDITIEEYGYIIESLGLDRE